MSLLLPYVLSELRDLSLDEARRAPRRWCRDPTEELLNDLLLYREAREAPRHPLHHLLEEHPVVTPQYSLVLRPRYHHPARRTPSAVSRHQARGSGQGDAAVQRMQSADNKNLLINIDVQQFKPEELSVQVLKDEGFVVIEGKHEERIDEHGFVQRQFTRRYRLPADVDPDTVTSRLSSDGVLSITAPRKQESLPAPKDNVKQITISHTNEPAVSSLEDQSANAQPHQEEKPAEEEKQ